VRGWLRCAKRSVADAAWPSLVSQDAHRAISGHAALRELVAVVLENGVGSGVVEHEKGPSRGPKSLS
jgi:hypothetical protein